jgi:hypothetical protein
MLAFYYDFMDVFVDRRDFQYCAMDTDSAYMALSTTSLEEVIKPDMQQQKNWFVTPDPDCLVSRTSIYLPLLISLVFLLTPLQLKLSSAPKQK